MFIRAFKVFWWFLVQFPCSSSSQAPPAMHNFMFSFVFNTLVIPATALHLYVVIGPTTGAWATYMWVHSQVKVILHQLPVLMCGSSWTVPNPCGIFTTFPLCRSDNHRCYEFVSTRALHFQKTAFHRLFLFSWLLYSFYFFLCNVSDP